MQTTALAISFSLLLVVSACDGERTCTDVSQEAVDDCCAQNNTPSPNCAWSSDSFVEQCEEQAIWCGNEASVVVNATLHHGDNGMVYCRTFWLCNDQQ